MTTAPLSDLGSGMGFLVRPRQSALSTTMIRHDPLEEARALLSH
jgi:hypothetical protein